MKVSSVNEVRTVQAVVAEGARHFFFDGTVYQKGTGKGNFAGVEDSGAMKGNVKVVALRNLGRFSLRSVGRKGNGRLVHVSGNTRLVVDGAEWTVADFYNHFR